VDRATRAVETTVFRPSPGETPPGIPPRTVVTHRFTYNATIHYSNASSLEIDGSSVDAGSRFSVLSTAAGTPVTLNAGAAHDTFTATLSARRSRFSLPRPTVLGPLTINGQGGSNPLTVNDPADWQSSPFTMDSSTIAHPSNGTITYRNLASITLNGGS